MHKRKKRYFHISMAVFMLVLGACSRPESGENVVPDAMETPTVTVHPGEVTPMVSPSPVLTEVPTQIPSPSPVPTSTPSPVIAPTLTPSPVPTTRPTATPEPTKIPAPEAPVIVGEDGVLAENELCRVQLVSFGKEEKDVVLRFLVENKSERDLIFSAQDVYVNRVINSFFEVEVPAGETAEERVLLFSPERLGITDISEVTEIFIPLEIYDARQVTYEAIWSGRGNMPWLEELSLCDWPCVIYPRGEESAVPFSYERQADDVVIAENEYFTMLLIDEVYEESGGYTAKLFVENHTEEPLFLEMEEYSLNGFRCEPYYGWELYLQGGTKAFGAIEWYGNRLEESEGDRVERLDFTLYARGAGLFSEERYRVYPKGEAAFEEYLYIPGEQDVILYDGPECMLALTKFTTMINRNEKKLVGTAYFVNKSEEELSFRIEGTAQVYTGDGKTDEWNMISEDLWYKDVGGGEKQKLVLYLDAYPENPEDGVWKAAYGVKIGKGGEDFSDEWMEVAVPMEAFED